MLEVTNLSAAYDDREVLTEVSFALEVGMIVAVLGPNGAGKTSLIKAINGTVRVIRGEILIGGSPISNFSRGEIARRIAVVAQENETKFPVSVLEYVLSGRFSHGGVFGWETVEDIQIARRALQECEMSTFQNRMMNELSGGERQRVVFARALATEAKILLLDEPTANLDIAHQAVMFRLVRERCRRAGHSSIVVTHDLNIASEFADKILLLRDGRVHSLGAPKDVLTEDNIREVFAVDVYLDQNPASQKVRVTNLY